jgi:hypothetical protein
MVPIEELSATFPVYRGGRHTCHRNSTMAFLPLLRDAYAACSAHHGALDSGEFGEPYIVLGGDGKDLEFR